MGTCMKIASKNQENIENCTKYDWMKTSGKIDKFLYMRKINTNKYAEIQELMTKNCIDLTQTSSAITEDPAYNANFVLRYAPKLKKGIPNFMMKDFLVILFSLQPSLLTNRLPDVQDSSRHHLDHPYFGRKKVSSAYLSTEGLKTMHKILYKIEIEYPDLNYCPLIPRLVQLLLWFVPECAALEITLLLIQESLLVKSGSSKDFINNSLVKMKSLIKKAFFMIKTPFSKAAAKAIVSDMINDMLVDVIPLEYISLVLVGYLVNGIGFIAVLAGLLYSYISAKENPKIEDLYDMCQLINIPSLIYQAQGTNNDYYTSQLSSMSIVSDILVNYTPKFSRHSKLFITEELRFILFQIIPKAYLFGNIYNEFCILEDGLLISDLNFAWEKESIGSFLVVKHKGGIFGVYFDRNLSLIKKTVTESECYLFISDYKNSMIYSHIKDNSLGYFFSPSKGIVIGNENEEIVKLDYSLQDVHIKPSQTFQSPEVPDGSELQIQCLELYLFK